MKADLILAMSQTPEEKTEDLMRICTVKVRRDMSGGIVTVRTNWRPALDTQAIGVLTPHGVTHPADHPPGVWASQIEN